MWRLCERAIWIRASTNDAGAVATQQFDPASSGRIGLIAGDADIADSRLMLLAGHAYAGERLTLKGDLAGRAYGQSFGCLPVAQRSAESNATAGSSALRDRGNDRSAAALANAMGPERCARAAHHGGISLPEMPVAPSVVVAFVGRHFAGRSSTATDSHATGGRSW